MILFPNLRRSKYVMDFQKTLLYVAFGFVSLWLYGEWTKDYNMPQLPEQATVLQTEAPAGAADQSSVSTGDGFVPDLVDATQQPATPAQVSATVLQQDTQRYVDVQTDSFNIRIDTVGGDIVSATLPKFPASLEHKDVPFTLLFQGKGRTYIAQSGLLDTDKSGNAPDQKSQRARYQVAQNRYILSEGQDTLRVPLSYQNANGVAYTKTFVFHADSYLIDIEYTIHNPSQQQLSHRMYAQLLRDQIPEHQKGFGMATYLGTAYGTKEDRYTKYSFDDISDDIAEGRKFSQSTIGGWVAMVQHYFVGAYIPTKDENNLLYTSKDGNNNVGIGYQAPQFTVAPGATVTESTQLYLGPKDQDFLEPLADGVDLTVDYGFLFFISKPLFWLLELFHSVFNNWGLAIIFVTLTVKAAFYRLSAAQYRSMARMRQLQPKLAQLKERYGHDRQKMSMKMMEMYRTEKVNPLGGCLPILIQMPVFLALYWVLMESVELRQAPFFLWIEDLSIQDPYYVLPLLMGASMYLMQKLSPQAFTDPVQQKVMQLMPVLMTAFFVFFPAGLVLYWVVNNCLSIAQQWWVTKQVEAQSDSKGKKA